MCGIIGYLGPQDAVEVIMDGLARLEYRGYDSAGLAVVTGPDAFTVRRAQGKLSRLAEKLANDPVSGRLGMGHTRWATHGRPSETNAHPHLSGEVAVVHNGIIENYLELKRELVAAGYQFSSETDTEIVAHLVADQFKQGAADLEQAVRRALRRIRGSYALVILDRRQPDTIVGARKDSPLVLGLGPAGRVLPGLRRAGLPGPHQPGGLPARRRPGGDQGRGLPHHRPGGRRAGAPGDHHLLVPGHGREGRLQALHGKRRSSSSPGPWLTPSPAGPRLATVRCFCPIWA